MSERLIEKRVDTLPGFQVPVLLRCDDEFMAIEMAIVMRSQAIFSFVLPFKCKSA